MTHREQLLALLAEFGLEPATEEEFGRGMEPGQVVLLADYGGVDGYGSFYVSFGFDAEGRFTEAGVWE